MPDSLEQLDFQSLYISAILAASLGNGNPEVYPRDLAEIRVFHEDRFFCCAVCAELAGEAVPARQILRARNRRRWEKRLPAGSRERREHPYST